MKVKSFADYISEFAYFSNLKLEYVRKNRYRDFGMSYRLLEDGDLFITSRLNKAELKSSRFVSYNTMRITNNIIIIFPDRNNPKKKISYEGNFTVCPVVKLKTPITQLQLDQFDGKARRNDDDPKYNEYASDIMYNFIMKNVNIKGLRDILNSIMYAYMNADHNILDISNYKY